jgi:hypothetical protein
VKLLIVPVLAVLLAGSASGAPRPARAPALPGPTAEELEHLMGVLAQAAWDDGITSVSGPRVTRHQCVPTGHRRQFRCCYVDERGRRWTAVVQREREEDLPPGETRKWRWVTGARHCG